MFNNFVFNVLSRLENLYKKLGLSCLNLANIRDVAVITGNYILDGRENHVILKHIMIPWLSVPDKKEVSLCLFI